MGKKIRPERPELITDEAKRVNGYSEETWEESIDLRTAVEEYKMITKGAGIKLI